MLVWADTDDRELERGVVYQHCHRSGSVVVNNEEINWQRRTIRG
jgi:hypothetical protein